MEIRAFGPKGFIARGGLVPAAFLASALLALLCAGCAEPGYGGTKLCGTEVPDPWEVAGCADLQDGEPAIAARVVAYPVGDAQAKGSASGGSAAARDSFVVETESHGLYRFPSLPPGEYDLYIEDTANKNIQGWQVHRQPNIRVNVGGKQTLPTYQLRTAGLFTLSVVDEKNDSTIEGAECRVEGTPYRLPPTDAIGSSFIFLPAGLDSSDLFRVTCTRSPYSETSLYFEINSNKTTSRRMKMAMGESAPIIPKPLNIVAVEDTSTGIVRVSWSKPLSTELFEYVLKRNEMDNPAMSKTWPLGGDSVYYDAAFGGEPDSVTAKALQYSVACVKRKGGSGDWAYGKPITVVRGPSVELKFLDTASSCRAGDTIRIVGGYSNRFHFNTRVSWTLKGGPDTLRTFEVSNRTGADTLNFPCSASRGAQAELQMRVKDETGLSAIGRIPVQIIPVP